MEINKEQLKIWIAALRSGEYKQTTRALQNEHGYCCLGVACKVLIPADKLELDKHGFIDWGIASGQPAAPDWLKLINGDYANKMGPTLIMLNDEFNFTFNQIADLLEKTYLSDGTK